VFCVKHKIKRNRHTKIEEIKTLLAPYLFILVADANGKWGASSLIVLVNPWLRPAPSGKVMSSRNIIKDTTSQSQRLIVENSPHDWNRCKHRLNKALEELESTFDKMPIADKAQYSYLCPGPQQLVTRPTQCQMIRQPMDPKSRLRAIKVFNVMLARLWRRRCAEVCDLHELVRKYQQKVRRLHITASSNPFINRDSFLSHIIIFCRLYTSI